jgi:hypothetical protein
MKDFGKQLVKSVTKSGANDDSAIPNKSKEILPISSSNSAHSQRKTILGNSSIKKILSSSMAP